MNILHSLSLKFRLVLLTAAFSVLLLVVGAFGMLAMSTAELRMVALYEQNLVPSSELSRVLEHMQVARTGAAEPAARSCVGLRRNA
ncbi:MAG: Tar ligand binding domain-containing protein [Thiohalomonadaceae bacterium]